MLGGDKTFSFFLKEEKKRDAKPGRGVEGRVGGGPARVKKHGEEIKLKKRITGRFHANLRTRRTRKKHRRKKSR